MDQKAWIETPPTLRLDELGRRVAKLRVAEALKGRLDTAGFDYQLDWRGK